MKIRILKCFDSLMWYSKHIGEVFEVYRDFDIEYLVRDSSGFSNIILKADCEQVYLKDETRISETYKENK